MYRYFHRFIQSPLLLIIITMILLLFEFNIPTLSTIFTQQTYNPERYSCLMAFLALTFLLFLCIPITLSKVMYRKNPSHLGLCLPRKPIEAMILSFITLAFCIPMVWLAANNSSFHTYYSLHHLTLPYLIFMFTILFPLYYLCEEFFFRGFLLMNLWQKSTWHALWINDLLFMIAHFTKPIVEIAMALPMGIMLALLTLRTKSIFPAIAVHYLIGVTIIFSVNHMS